MLTLEERKKRISMLDKENYIQRRTKLGKIVKPLTNPKGCKIKRCTVCKIILTTLNWDKDNKKDRLYQCNDCWKVYDRDQARKHTIQTFRNGKMIYLKGNKRPYPQNHCCEICDRYTEKLDYHHWDDLDISKGIWCCYLCNQMSDRIERDLHLKYLKLKQDIEIIKGG